MTEPPRWRPSALGAGLYYVADHPTDPAGDDVIIGAVYPRSVASGYLAEARERVEVFDSEAQAMAWVEKTNQGESDGTNGQESQSDR